MEFIGRQFGHIRVTGVVGEGGMGAVYLGEDEKLDRKVALKVLHADQRLDEEARERLLREARALSKVDHPNICRIHDYIETGDVDLLVLEYIDGRTLQRAMEDNLPYSEKLRIALTIAEVLVRAHRAGIVHRDLKPENVMITKTGEVKVLDFGLARWLNRARRSSGNLPALDDSAKLSIKENEDLNKTPPLGQTIIMPSARPSEMYANGRREFLATAVGITLGTPLYMSPEQARGESLTPASDMFSFGLLLQVLFTGREPHPDYITVREVILRVARGETNPVEGAPKAITALINSLKAFAPADRPTAVQTVERLKFLIGTPQRIARRTAIATVAAVMLFGGWRYTVDLDRERTIAVNERAEAQRQKAKAEDLINFMVGDLRKKLEPVGRLDVLDDVAEKALQYVSGLRPEAMSIDELLRNANALNQLGEVRVGQGKTPEALALFQKSLSLVDAAMQREPRNPEALKTFGITHFWLGNSERLKGNLDQAFEHMSRYMEAGDALASLDISNKEYQLERAYGHSGVALILEAQGKLQQALRHYTVSFEVKQQLALRDPNDKEAQNELARAINKLAVLQYKLGDLKSARDHSRREVDIWRGLLAREPLQTIWKQRLSNSLAYLARAYTNTGQADAALALWNEALLMNRELAARDPENVEWQRNVAMTLRWLAADRKARRDDAGAVKLAREAVAIIDDVVKRAPTRSSFLVDAMNVRIDYGRLMADAGDPRGAAMLRDAVRRLETVPNDRLAHYQAARAALNLGEVLGRRDPAAAAAAFGQADREMQKIIATTATPEDLALYSRILIRRDRPADARAVLARLRPTGYATSELEVLLAAANPQ